MELLILLQGVPSLSMLQLKPIQSRGYSRK